MSGSGGYSSPNFVIPYAVPANTPPQFMGLVSPIYIAFQNIIQTLINFCGIAPRNSTQLLSSLNDPTACLANNVHRFYTEATETIAQGSPINLYASSGVLFVRNASATNNTKQADGFCSQSGGITAGAVGEVILGDGVATTSGLTPGTRYYLGTTAGSYSATAPSAAGNISQPLGIALTSTALKFQTSGFPIVQY